MGRRRQGWTLRRRAAGGIWKVRFTVAGRVVERSTGTADREQATREAGRIYAHAIATEPAPRHRRRAGSEELEVLIGAWLISLSTTHAAGTLKTWELYATTHFLAWFPAAHSVTSAECAGYMRARLGLVQATTVRKELTALRSLVGWLAENGVVPDDTLVPTVPRRATGKPHPVRRRSAAIELSPAETEALIAALPEWSTSRRVKPFPIRARFLVAYETGLRPALLDGLSAPLHYRHGAPRLRVTAELDKSRWVREVPLSPGARAALDSACPKGKEGPIFGSHDYRPHLAAAARAALSPDRAERFAGAHLRSARITHWLEETGNLPAVQYLVGHKLTATTARYVRPSLRAAESILGRPKNYRGRKGAKGGT